MEGIIKIFALKDENIDKNCKLDIYLSCCIDVVSAEHYNADSLIHYGHSCLNKTEKLPVLFIFEKYNLYIDLLKNELNKIIDKISINEYQEKKILIIYDVSYYHLHGKL